MDDEQKSVTKCVFMSSCISLLIALIILLAAIIPAENATDESIPSVCTTTSYDPGDYRCCKTHSCVCAKSGIFSSHEECEGTSCSSMMKSKTEGKCCGGYQCCEDCYTTETYSCNCDSKGSNCGTCTREVYCGCDVWVDHETCKISCNTCYKPVAKIDISNGEGSYTEKVTCGYGKHKCEKSFKTIWNVSNKTCWWHKQENEIYWDEPITNITAVVFAIIFGVYAVLAPMILACVYGKALK